MWKVSAVVQEGRKEEEEEKKKKTKKMKKKLHKVILVSVVAKWFGWGHSQ